MGDAKKTALVVDGPNLSLLGIREPQLYGHETLTDAEAAGRQQAEELGVTVGFFQRSFIIN